MHTSSIVSIQIVLKVYWSAQHSAVDIPSAKRLRSCSLPMNWKETCMLCCKPAMVDARHPERMRVRRASTIPLRSTLLEH